MTPPISALLALAALTCASAMLGKLFARVVVWHRNRDVRGLAPGEIRAMIDADAVWHVDEEAL